MTGKNANSPRIFPPSESIHEGSSVCPDWLVWQLVDSAFPTGGFVHSFGLEAAWQQGEIRGREGLVLFSQASLDQLGHAGLPFVLAAFDNVEPLHEIDRLCNAFTNNHVANRASKAQGRSLLSAVERIFPLPDSNQDPQPTWPYGHFAPVFGACMRRLNMARETVGRMFFFNQLRGILAAAVRLNIVGPLEAQILSSRLFPVAEAILKECWKLTLDDIAQTAPLLDVWQGAHDRLYSRLFQS